MRDLNDILADKIHSILSGDDNTRCKYRLYDHLTIEAALRRAEEGQFFLIEDGHVTGIGRYWNNAEEMSTKPNRAKMYRIVKESTEISHMA